MGPFVPSWASNEMNPLQAGTTRNNISMIFFYLFTVFSQGKGVGHGFASWLVIVISEV